MQGEKLVYGNAHADNVAPALGWIYVSEKLQPLDIIKNRKSFRIICDGGSSSD
jgi:hypothetical protein